MEYFILNEHSLPINNYDEIDSCLFQFFDIYKVATRKNFTQIRVSNNIDTSWYEILISENKSIREWIKDQNYDYSSRLKSLISATSCPIFSTADIDERLKYEQSEFQYEGITVPNIGAAFLLQQLTLSFNTSDLWNYSIFKVKHLTT